MAPYEDEEKVDYCPTQSGKLVGYKPQFYADGKWQVIGTRVGKCGIPGDKIYSGVLNTIGLFSYEQCMALAWGFSAEAAAHGEGCRVRVQPYSVSYDIKAKKMEEPEDELPSPPISTEGK